jgi:hypothetical protein
MSVENTRQLWRYDANGDGILTGVFFAVEQDIDDVAGMEYEHPDVGIVVVKPEDFGLVASDEVSEEDSNFIDAAISRGVIVGFDPIEYLAAQSAIGLDDEWTIALDSSDFDTNDGDDSDSMTDSWAGLEDEE